MKDKFPLDRRQFFQYLRLRAARPEVFRSGKMMRIDELCSRDRPVVEILRPSWRSRITVILAPTEIRAGGKTFPLSADESAILEAIDGERTLGEIIAVAGGPELYTRCLRLLTLLLREGVLDLK